MKLFLSLALLLAVCAIPSWMVYRGQDLEETEDSDLRVKLRSLSDEDNAYAYLTRVAEDLEWPEGAAVTPELLDQNRYALKHLVHLLAAPEMQFPPYLAPGDEAPDVTRWIHIAELLGQRAWLRTDYAQQRLALADGIAILRMGKLIEGARAAAVVHARAGITIKGIGLDSLEDTVNRRPLEPGRARRLIRQVEALRSDPDARARMWATEYQSIKTGAVRAFESGFADRDVRIGAFSGLSRQAIRLAPDSYIFHPNRTFSELAKLFRALQADAPRVCSELSAARELANRYNYTGWRQLVAPNGVGQLYMAVLAPDFRAFERARCHADTRISLLQARLAVEAYQAERGKPPESLGALVPNYVAVLPPDGFDGKPVRFSRERRQLWSEGDESLSISF